MLIQLSHGQSELHYQEVNRGACVVCDSVGTCNYLARYCCRFYRM